MIIKDEANISTTDFSVVVKNINYKVPNLDFDNELKVFFEENSFPNRKCDIK